MSKRFIWIVTVFMGLAMASLILVQAYWIKNAILVKEKQFDQLITRSMIDIAREIEQLEMPKYSARMIRFHIRFSQYYSVCLHPGSRTGNITSIQGDENEGDRKNRRSGMAEKPT